ncbi:MAG: cryptochrome/photolyase family protein, partial [Prochlorococcaceae cyanobacterium]
MAIAIWVLNDQLHQTQAALASYEPGEASVVFVEAEALLRVRPHLQKQILFWSAQRHFAAELQTAGWDVHQLEAVSHADALIPWLKQQGISRLVVMAPPDRPIRQAIERLSQQPEWPCELEWIDNNQFLWTAEEFSRWAGSKKQLRMEFFYREGRRRFDVLMDGDQPQGGQWNFDQDNRKPPPKGLEGPEPLWFEPDSITSAVISKLNRLAERYELPGTSDPFRWGVSQQQAQEVLEHFIATRLEGFGPYQDAMVSGQPTLWHSL